MCMVECHAGNRVAPMRGSHIVTLALNVLGDAGAEALRVAQDDKFEAGGLRKRKTPDVESGEEILE
jgi:hypothetical protein